MAAKLDLTAWPKDILRHTTASMLMPTWEDEGKVAATLGNSPSILHAHYRELVTKERAKENSCCPRLPGVVVDDQITS